MKHSGTYDHYYLYQEITDLLRGYAQAHPHLTKLHSIGMTPQGRDIWALEITDTSCGGFDEKPAFYVEGNIHAGEVTGSMCVMYFLDTLFSNLEDPSVARLLKDHTIYAVPRVSPDGSEHYLTTPDAVRSAPRRYPFAQVMPGLNRCDLDGDGVIRMMRVRTPYGVWKPSEKDPRLMTRRRPDDREGDFYNIYEEGVIEEFDGLNITEAPAAFGNDFNRNYPVGWQTEDLQKGAGAYPLCHPETRANADFLMQHPNVCFVVDMHTSGGQNLFTPGFESSKKAHAADIALYRSLGAMAKEENGYPVLNVYDDYMPASASVTYGGFDDFCHFVLGIPAMTIECWDLSERAGVPLEYPPRETIPEAEEEENAVKFLQWMDANLPAGEGFRPWQAFSHPQLGEVEIGGCDEKFIRQNPPIPFLQQELEKHTRFMLRAVNTLPSVCFESVTSTPLGGDLYRVEAIVGNRGFMPTYVFEEGLKSKALEELTLTLSAEGCTFETGKAAQKIGHLEGLSGVAAHNNGLRMTSSQKNPLRKKVTWLLRGPRGALLILRCHGGRIGCVCTEAVL